MKGKHISGTIRPDQKEWVDKKIEEKEFYNTSHAIQRCIMISKRVYENGTNDEKAKFLHGIVRK